MSRLTANDLTLGYGDAVIVRNLNLEIEDGKITTIIGPNGCGKSTLLRGLARLLDPVSGQVHLDGQLIHSYATRDVAKRLGLQSQQAITPQGIMVEDLVRRGRYPHQSFFQPPSAEDEAAVDKALDLTGMQGLRKRAVDTLSGGQRQRAWMAMAVAQDTPILLLDEPTTYLDVSHQLEVIDLVEHLNRVEGKTIVMVLHDINEAARVSDRIVAMRDGVIVKEGTPDEVFQPETLAALYGITCDIYPHSTRAHCFCLPRSGDCPPSCAVKSAATPGDTAAGQFSVQGLRTGYGRTTIIDDLSLDLPAGKMIAIVGPNACGKSTLFRSCARLLKRSRGAIQLDGREIASGSHKALAKRMTLLSQGPVPPSGFSVEDLVASGRVPHQGLFRQWSADDEAKVDDALERTNLNEFRHREVDTLSGGQRQRAWFGMSLAQDTPVLLLDEPTTFLDMAAQIDLLDLARQLNREHGYSVLMILHDLNMAARYADVIVAMKAGKVVRHGTPAQVLTPDLLRDVFDIEATVHTDPQTGSVMIMPVRTVSPTAVAEVEREDAEAAADAIEEPIAIAV
ncbi:MAG TPA: ABC transporter ATP-binding protein [Thermomicrobiales bacterium]|nr:ABC transporter ATP-binding protein [Thermomicrobiales bacterium]